MKKYIILKTKKEENTILDSKKIGGYKLSPRNSFEYPGIAVDSLILIKTSFIEKILKKKIKRKLDYYLKYIINLIDETDDGSSYKEALNEMSKYKDMVEYKYRMYLDDKYINILLKKISLLEYEIKSKTIKLTPKIEKKYYEPVPEIENEEVRHRRR